MTPSTPSLASNTDVGYLTADPALCADADAVFQQLASPATVEAPRQLLVAPFSLHERMLAHIEQVAEAAYLIVRAASRSPGRCGRPRCASG